MSNNAFLEGTVVVYEGDEAARKLAAEIRNNGLESVAPHIVFLPGVVELSQGGQDG